MLREPFERGIFGQFFDLDEASPASAGFITGNALREGLHHPGGHAAPAGAPMLDSGAARR